MIGVTGATGQLGRRILAALQSRGVPAGEIVALARDPSKLAAEAAAGIQTRAFDYDGSGLVAALTGIDTLVLVSGSEFGARARQHGAVAKAAKEAGVGLIAYTSLLHADSSAIDFASEHVASEEAIKASGVPYILLRNGWYSENYAGTIQGAAAGGVIAGPEAEGVINSASRDDYAAAAAAAVTGGAKPGDVLELAGDAGWTMSDLAGIVGGLAGKPVRYDFVAETDYAKALEGYGLPAPVAAVLAQAAAATAQGALADGSGTLSKLIGRPTTPVADTARAILGQA